MKLKEAKKSKCGTTDHSTWRNYDDLNEYFWLALNLSYTCVDIYPVIQSFASNELGSWDWNLLSFGRSPDCFEIGWPMRLDHDFFCIHSSTKSNAKKASVSTDPGEERRNEDGEEDEVGVYHISSYYWKHALFHDCS